MGAEDQAVFGKTEGSVHVYSDVDARDHICADRFCR